MTSGTEARDSNPHVFFVFPTITALLFPLIFLLLWSKNDKAIQHARPRKKQRKNAPPVAFAFVKANGNFYLFSSLGTLLEWFYPNMPLTSRLVV